MIRLARYFMARALESMRRSFWLVAATVGMLVVILLLFNVFLMVAINVNALTDRWVGAVRMIVFLDPVVNPAEAQDLALELRKRPEVLNAFYVTQQDATARFLADFPSDKDILEGLPQNPLPASLELELSPTAMNLDDLSRLAEELSARPEVDEAVFGRELFAKLSALVGLLKLIGGIFGLALAVAVLFLSANTIRLNLYARREEIEVMQNVGATRWFIRWPYLIEGLIQGAGGALCSLLLAYGLFRLTLQPLTEALLGPLGHVNLGFLSLPVMVTLVLAGMALGAGGSMVALGRFWRSM